MVTWANLSDGFSYFGSFITDHPHPISELVQSNFLQEATIDLIGRNLLNFVGFIFLVTCVLLIFTVIFDFLYLVLTPFIRRLTQWF